MERNETNIDIFRYIVKQAARYVAAALERFDADCFEMVGKDLAARLEPAKVALTAAAKALRDALIGSGAETP